MIIKKLDIENFGKFSGRSINFNPGFNLILGNNEDGKSTLMSFIKLMFYGNLGKSTDISKNPRKKYAPWSGASMSGSIEFESDSESFRLHKEFQRSAASDLVSVFNQNRGERLDISPSQEIGQVFLDMTLGEFERSFFIESFGGFSSDASGDSLAMRIANLAASGDESISQALVMARITAAKEELISKSGKKGFLVDARERVEKLKSELSALSKQTENQLSLMTEISELKKEISELEQAIEVIDSAKTADKAKKDLKALSALAESLKLRENLLQTLHKWCSDVASLKAKVKKLKELRFRIPTTIQVDEGKITHDDYRRALVIEDELSALQQDKQLIEGRLKAAVSVFVKAFHREQKKSRRNTVIILVLLAILGVFGVGLMLIQQYNITGFYALLLSVGIGLCLIPGRQRKIYKSKAVKTASDEYEDCLRHLSFFSEDLLKESPEKIESILQGKLSRFFFDFRELLKSFGCSDFEEFKAKAAESFARAETVKAAEQLKEQFTQDISQLAAVSSFEEAQEIFKEICSTLTLFEETDRKILVMSDLSGFAANDSKTIESQILQLSELIENTASRTHMPALFLQDVDIECCDTHKLKQKLAEKRQLLGELQSRTSPPAASEDLLLLQLSEERSAERELSDRYKALNIASKALEAAISEMNKGLGSLLNQKTGEYLSKITGGKYSEVMVSRNLEVEARSSLAEGYHHWKHLSSGAIDKIYLALRLAAADIIAQKHNPLPLFLDDILTQYDSESCKNALVFLKEYLKTSGSVSQIFFFTCHRHIAELAKELIPDSHEIIL